MEGKVINFGIVSTAGIAGKLLPAIQDSPNANIVAVASRSVEKAQQWIEKNNLQIKAYGSYEELFQDKNIDAVYIPLPTGLKYEFAKKALESGKHALIEKPLPGVIDTKQLQELIEISKKTGLQLMDATMWVHSDRTQVIRKLIDQGEIGKVSKVVGSLTFKSDDDFMKNNIRGDIALEPLGALGDVTWYPTMATLWTYNFEAPLRVQAVSWQKSSTGVYTEMNGIIYFKDNKIAFVDGSFLQCLRQNFEIVGETGAYRLDDYVGGQNQNGDGSVFWKRFAGAGNYVYLDKDGKKEERTLEKSDHVVKMVNELAKRIKENDNTQYWINRSLLCQQVCVHFHLSAEKNGAILDFDQKL